MRNVHLGPVPERETREHISQPFTATLDLKLHSLDRLLRGHVAARIKGIRWWSRVHVKGRLDAHAQRHDRPHLQAHRTPPITSRLVLAPVVVSCNYFFVIIVFRDNITVHSTWPASVSKVSVKTQ